MDITRSYGKHEIAPSDQIAYIVLKVSVGGTQIRLDYDNSSVKLKVSTTLWINEPEIEERI